MHRLFAEWHRIVGGSLADVSFDERWEVVEELSQQLGADGIANFVRLAFQRPVQIDAVDAMSDRFQQVEPGFPMRDNSRLLSVLAGAVVNQALVRGDAVGVATAYAVEAAARVSWVPLVSDLAAEARRILLEESR